MSQKNIINSSNQHLTSIDLNYASESVHFLQSDTEQARDEEIVIRNVYRPPDQPNKILSGQMIVDHKRSRRSNAAPFNPSFMSHKSFSVDSQSASTQAKPIGKLR